jgi:hypothetical protein
MAVTLGTNSGFVTTAPTADPAGTNFTIDGVAVSTKHTSPEGNNVITEFGWWCDTASEASNYEIGLYAADGATVPGEAGTRLQYSATQAKGTNAGWKVVTGLNWSISASTVYWLAVQLDNVTTTTSANRNTSGGAGYDVRATQTTLSDPFGGGTLSSATIAVAIYAVTVAAGPAKLKTWNGLATAKIKTIDGLVIAKVKTINGLV